MPEFVHLHTHSEYSLLDGGNRIPQLVEGARALGMNALALTDHGNLFGAVTFHTAARDAGLKPILGMEAFISPSHRTDRSMGNIQTAAYHLAYFHSQDLDSAARQAVRAASLIVRCQADFGWRPDPGQRDGADWQQRVDRALDELLADLDTPVVVVGGPV